MSLQSLEAERQAILERMRARREEYRRMLTDGEMLGEMPMAPQIHDAGIHAHGYAASPIHSFMPAGLSRNTVMRVLNEHPLWVALGVAAIVAIGPRRILRTIATSGTAVAALTASNPSNVDLVGRLITMAGAYVQGRSKPPQ